MNFTEQHICLIVIVVATTIGGHCDSVFSRSEKVRAALLELYESTRGENWRVSDSL